MNILRKSCNNITPITLKPDQVSRLHMHVAMYALMLSEQELLDKAVFDHTHSEFFAKPIVKKLTQQNKCILQ